MNMHTGDALNSADPVDFGAQSDLASAHEPLSIEAVLAAPNGYAHSRPGCWLHFVLIPVAVVACGLKRNGWVRPGRCR